MPGAPQINTGRVVATLSRNSPSWEGDSETEACMVNPSAMKMVAYYARPYCARALKHYIFA